MTYKDLKEWVDEEFKRPKEQIYTFYVGSKEWERIKKDENHPFHYVLKRQKEEYLKNINNGKENKRGKYRKNK